DDAEKSSACDCKMEMSAVKWEQQMAPYQGASIVPYHPNFIYFADRFGLKLFGTVEPKPGIPPSPHYLNQLGESMKSAGIKVVVYQPYYNADACNEVAKRVGGVAVEIATEVGGVPGTDDVFTKFDVLVSSVAGALAGKSGGAR